MVDIFYETSLEQVVSLEKSGDQTVLKLERVPKSAFPNLVSVNRADIAIANDDVYVLDLVRSGTGRQAASGIYSRILRPLFDSVLLIPHQYIATDSPSSIDTFAASLNSNGRPITLVVIAGDTSVNEFINGLSPGHQALVKILIVPAGTGNSLALSIGLTDEVAAVKKLVLYGETDVRPLNLYLAQFPAGSYFLHHDGTKSNVPSSLLFLVVTSWAFHASLVADSDLEEMRKNGIDRFKIAAGQNLGREQKYLGDFSVTRQGATTTHHNGPFAYFVVTPSKKFEPTFEVLPKGNIFDSNLYVVGFPTEQDDKYIMDIMMEVYAGGKHVENDKVFYNLVEKDQVIKLLVRDADVIEKRRFCVDGAIVVLPELEGEVEIRYHGPEANGWKVSIIS